jgi:hypothetical protein
LVVVVVVVITFFGQPVAVVVRYTAWQLLYPAALDTLSPLVQVAQLVSMLLILLLLVAPPVLLV